MRTAYNSHTVEIATELMPVAEAVRRASKDPSRCAGIVKAVTHTRESQREIFALKIALHAEGDAVERVLLSYAIEESAPKLDMLPVHPRVIAVMRKEFDAYRKPPGAKPPLMAGTDPFVTACKIATLRRFTAGPIDWVISGVPWSWIPKFRLAQIPGALDYLLRVCGGSRPMFYLHLAPAPRNRSLVIPAEVHRAYYRMARSLELQPEIRAIGTASWFHDPEVVRQTPHLAPLNAPYLEWGGRIVGTLGEAPPDAGFLDYNPERRKLYESGQMRPRTTLAVWPRAAAIEWARQHSELD